MTAERQRVSMWTSALVLVLQLAGSTPAQLPPGWACTDIGTTGGDASEVAGTWTVTGNGENIWDKADSFHYVYKQVSGDCEIIARVASIQPTHEWAKAGVMIRQTLLPDSPHVFMALTPWRRTIYQYRSGTNQHCSSVHSDNYRVTFPCWLRLVRQGDTFTGYYSADGVTWTAQPNYENRSPARASNPVTVPMNNKLYIGLAVTSHRSDGLLCQAEFDNVAASSQPDLHIRTDDEWDYTGDGVYASSSSGIAAKQTKSQLAAHGMIVIYDVKLENDGPVLDSFIILGLADNENWTVVYYDTSTGTDVTEQVTGMGWTSPSLAPGRYLELRIEITPGPDLIEHSLCNLLVRAMSSSDRHKVDMVRTETSFDPTLPSPPWGGSYSQNEDFDRGLLVNIEHETEPNQLQLSAEPSALPFLWVPNSNEEEGTVSKLDTKTARELGRYRTCPASVYGNPSRTTVDLEGNCWVANRNSGTVVKIGLLENGQCVDRNGNGLIETSRDLNGDGRITGDEVLPWGSDECALCEVVLIPHREGPYIPGQYRGTYRYFRDREGPRAIAVDKDNNVWAGCFGSMMYYHIDSRGGEILRQIDVSDASPDGHTPYGAVVDANGILWSSGHSRQHVLRLDPADDYSYSTIDLGHFAYGLGLGVGSAKPYLFVSGWEDSKLSRIRLDYTGDVNDIVTWAGFPWSRGVACTDNGDVWIVNSFTGKSSGVGKGAVTHCDIDGHIIERFYLGNVPTGVAVDGDGQVWVVDYGDEYVHRIDPNSREVFRTTLSGRHYGYSDMTGIVAWNPTVKTGWWTVMHNTKAFDCRLGLVRWKADVPRGTSLRFIARSSNDRRAWSVWQEVTNACALCSLPPGRYFEVKAIFQSENESTPRLYELDLCFVDFIDPYRQSDLNKDCVVDLRDVQIMSDAWLSRTSETPEPSDISPGPADFDNRQSQPDLNDNGTVDFEDFQIMAADWLTCIHPSCENSECLADENPTNTD